MAQVGKMSLQGISGLETPSPLPLKQGEEPGPAPSQALQPPASLDRQPALSPPSNPPLSQPPTSISIQQAATSTEQMPSFFQASHPLHAGREGPPKMLSSPLVWKRDFGTRASVSTLQTAQGEARASIVQHATTATAKPASLNVAGIQSLYRAWRQRPRLEAGSAGPFTPWASALRSRRWGFPVAMALTRWGSLSYALVDFILSCVDDCGARKSSNQVKSRGQKGRQPGAVRTPCKVLYCAVQLCIVLYSYALYCTVLYCTVLFSTVISCNVLGCTGS